MPRDFPRQGQGGRAAAGTKTFGKEILKLGGSERDFGHHGTGSNPVRSCFTVSTESIVDQTQTKSLPCDL